MGDAARRMLARRSEAERLELGLSLLDEEIGRVESRLEDLPGDPEARARRVYEALRSGADA